MPRRTVPNLEWRHYPLREGTGEVIERRLRRHRDRIATLLFLEDAAEIDAAIADLKDLYVRVVLFIREVDRTASVAQQRVNLRAFKEHGDFSLEAFEKLDPASQNRAILHHPDGGLMISQSSHDRTKLAKAVEAAIEALGSPKPGKPAETDSLALRQCALGLANVFNVYASNVGLRPMRSVAWKTHEESGPFLAFVAFVLALLPERLRSYKAGGQKRADFLARLAIEEHKKARESGDPTRLWTLDERLYLGEPKGE